MKIWYRTPGVERGKPLLGFPLRVSLPDSDSGKNSRFRLWRTDPEDYQATFLDEFQIEALHGDQRHKVVPQEVAPTRPPRIQVLLKLAYQFQERLKQDTSLSQSALARDLGITPTRVTQIMNLLRLAPDIQAYILRLEPVRNREGLSEKHMRTLCRIKNPKLQSEVFGHLAAKTRRAATTTGAVSTPPPAPVEAFNQSPKGSEA